MISVVLSPEDLKTHKNAGSVPVVIVKGKFYIIILAGKVEVAPSLILVFFSF